MKTQHYGLGPTTISSALSLLLTPSIVWDLGSEALADYVEKRGNGTNQDSPKRDMPKDGTYSWTKEGCAPGCERIRYNEGPGDRAWMEERDHNYLARIKKEDPALWAEELASLSRAEVSQRKSETKAYVLVEHKNEPKDDISTRGGMPHVDKIAKSPQADDTISPNSAKLKTSKQKVELDKTPNLKKIPAPPLSRLKKYIKLEDLDKELQISEEDWANCIGKGSFGKVYRGTFLGGIIAVKCVDTLAKNNPGYNESLRAFQRETQTWLKAKSERIVELYSIGLYRQNFAVVMEFMVCSLFDALHRNSPLNSTIRRQIALDTLHGLKYLYDLSLIHRDIKSQNILLDENYRAKLCDFGLTRALEGTLASTTSDGKSAAKGTPTHMAPEVLRSEENCYQFPCDMYSYGVVVWEIVTREKPYQDKGWNPVQLAVQVGYRGARPSIPQAVTQPMSTYIKGFWHEAPHQRSTVTQAIEQLPDKEHFPDDTSTKSFSEMMESEEAMSTTTLDNTSLHETADRVLDQFTKDEALRLSSEVQEMQQLLKATYEANQGQLPPEVTTRYEEMEQAYQALKLS